MSKLRFKRISNYYSMVVELQSWNLSGNRNVLKDPSMNFTKAIWPVDVRTEPN